MPFYVTTRGMGILVDTARYAVFYLGGARPKPSGTASTIVDSHPDPSYGANLQKTEDSSVTVEVPNAPGVDVYLFAGPAMIDAVRRYNLFSGGGILPPDWGLGFWYRMDSRTTQQSGLELAREFRQREIPCDVLGLEPGWQTHAYSCTFAWNKERFPDPDGFVRAIGELDYKVNLWEHAYTHPASELFADLKEASGDYGVLGGLVPDFAGNKAREAFADHHGRRFVDKGIAGFKLDECDNSDYTGGWSFPECSSFPSGVDGEQMHSVFGLRYQETIWRAFRERRKATFGLVRSSGALAAPYPFVLYSDLYNHRDFIRALVNSGFSGLLWCPEVRDAVSEEDLIRRLQSVVFSPLAMINGWYIKNPPWKQLNRQLNNADRLQNGWEALEARCKEIIAWRMRLVPYLRGAFGRYASDGTPPFRALVLDWPDAASLAKTDDAWMVGDRMLVAPLFAGEANGRSLTLPPGEWCDFWTGASVEAERAIHLTAETREIPVYLKAGSVLPLAPVTSSTARKEARELEVRIYGDGHIPFKLQLPKAELEISWDAKSAKGSVKQIGDHGYSVTKWTVMSEQP